MSTGAADRRHGGGVGGRLIGALRFVVVLLTLTGGAGAAQAQVDPPGALSPEAKSALEGESKRLFDDGVAAYDAGDYDAAIVRFRAAYARTQAAALLFNIAQALRRKGDCAGALQAYRNFAALAPEKARTLEVDNRIAELAPFCASEPKAAPPEASPTGSAGSAQGGAPLIPLQATAASAEPSASSPPTWRSRLGWSCLGLGVAGAVVGGYSAYAAHLTGQRIGELTDNGTAWNGFAAELDRQGQRQRDLALVSFIAAGTGLIAGIGLLAWERQLQHKQSDRQ